jgi:hypothetical protein
VTSPVAAPPDFVSTQPRPPTMVRLRRRTLLPVAALALACAPSSRTPQAPLPPPDQEFAAECVVAQARQEGFTTQRDSGRYTWLLARAYTGPEGVAREETIYLQPVTPAHPETVRVLTAAGATASPNLNAANFAPALDRVLRRVGAHCSPAAAG